MRLLLAAVACGCCVAEAVDLRCVVFVVLRAYEGHHVDKEVSILPNDVEEIAAELLKALEILRFGALPQHRYKRKRNDVSV